MNQSDRRQFAAEMFRLAESFGTKVSEARAEAYFEALKDYALPDIRVACGRVIAERAYFPKASEMIETVKAFQAEQRRLMPREERPRIRCGAGVPCEECEIVGCQCQGCIAAIAKCRAEFKAIAEKAATGGLFLMRVPPAPPAKEATREDYAAHAARKAQELERFKRLAAPADEDEVPF
jgi:hypothetical protein